MTGRLSQTGHMIVRGDEVQSEREAPEEVQGIGQQHMGTDRGLCGIQ